MTNSISARSPSVEWFVEEVKQRALRSTIYLTPYKKVMGFITMIFRRTGNGRKEKKKQRSPKVSKEKYHA